MRGRQKTFVEGPVDYTDLRTEFIGLIYEGLLDYRLKRTDDKIGPQVFLNLGREPVLPLCRLEDMLAHDQQRPEELAHHAPQGEGHGQRRVRRRRGRRGGRSRRGRRGSDEAGEVPEVELEAEAAAEEEVLHGGDYLDAVEAAKRWAREAVVLAGLVGKQTRRETDSEYQKRIEAEAARLIKRVVATGEFYLVRAGNTRKGTGTFYTRPQLAVPTVHRTLEPLCYDKAEDGTLAPKTPEVNPRAEGLRPGVRQRLVPGRGAALPDRRPLQVALPSPPARRPRAGQADHAPVRASSHEQGGRGTRAVPARRPAAGPHVCGADQGPAAAACRRAVHLRRGHQPAGRGVGPCVALGRDARSRVAVLVPRPQDQGRQLAGRLLAGPGGGLPAQGVGARGRRRQGRPAHADGSRRSSRARRSATGGAATGSIKQEMRRGHRGPVQQASRRLFPDDGDHDRDGRGPGPCRVRALARPADAHRPRRAGADLPGAHRGQPGGAAS